MSDSTMKGVPAAKVPISVVLGNTELYLEELRSVREGTILTLDSLDGEPVRVVASGTQIAWGEVVVVDESMGVRVTQLLGNNSDRGPQDERQ